MEWAKSLDVIQAIDAARKNVIQVIEGTTKSEAIATWAGVGATLFLGLVALFQENFKRWWWRPKFDVSVENGPPDCVQIDIRGAYSAGQIIRASSYYLRVKVRNTGNETARNVEIYATALTRQQQAGGQWERVKSFPPMNLVWANSPPDDPLLRMYLPFLPTKDVSKYCDVGHIIEPNKRDAFQEENPELKLTQDGVSLAFDLIQRPNNKGNIVRPGLYHLDIVVAAENAAPVKRTIVIDLKRWIPDEARMFSDGVNISIP
jgi:hypothetical protein